MLTSEAAPPATLPSERRVHVRIDRGRHAYCASNLPRDVRARPALLRRSGQPPKRLRLRVEVQRPERPDPDRLQAKLAVPVPEERRRLGQRLLPRRRRDSPQRPEVVRPGPHGANELRPAPFQTTVQRARLSHPTSDRHSCVLAISAIGKDCLVPSPVCWARAFCESLEGLGWGRSPNGVELTKCHLYGCRTVPCPALPRESGPQACSPRRSSRVEAQPPPPGKRTMAQAVRSRSHPAEPSRL